MGCVKTKLPHAAPASEFFTSPLFRGGADGFRQPASADSSSLPSMGALARRSRRPLRHHSQRREEGRAPSMNGSGTRCHYERREAQGAKGRRGHRPGPSAAGAGERSSPPAAIRDRQLCAPFGADSGRERRCYRALATCRTRADNPGPRATGIGSVVSRMARITSSYTFLRNWSQRGTSRLCGTGSVSPAAARGQLQDIGDSGERSLAHLCPESESCRAARCRRSQCACDIVTTSGRWSY